MDESVTGNDQLQTNEIHSPSNEPSPNAIIVSNASGQDVVVPATMPTATTTTSPTSASENSRPDAISRQNSSTSSRDSENKRTFLNRYVRKVKSFIKK